MRYRVGRCQDGSPRSQQIIQLQLQDSEELSQSAKGKQREGSLSDAQVALRLYTEELISTSSILDDRRMAQSMAMAVVRDGHAVQQAHEQEAQISRDHEHARSLQGNNDVTPNTQGAANPQMSAKKDPWSEEELLSKVAALYMQDADSTNTTLPTLTTDSDRDDTVAE